MARDPSITIRERLIKAARRWAAIGPEPDLLEPATEREVVRRIGDLVDAVHAYERYMGLRSIVFCTSQISTAGMVKKLKKAMPDRSEGNG